MQVADLAKVEFFGSLSRRELEQLAQWTDRVSVSQGHELARQGAFAHEFFLIEDGIADVVQDGKTIATLGAGDFFGEIGLLETERRTASVVAASDMQLIVMFQREFKQMERAMPNVAERIRAAIRARLS